MKKITTQSGSVYLVKVEELDTYPASEMFIKQESGVKQEGYRYQGNEYDDWQPCKITPWLPVLGEPLYFKRPNVPYGKGRITVTTPVERVEEV